MKKIVFLLAVFYITLCQHTWACDCGFEGKFLDVAPKKELVALIKVTRYLTFKQSQNREIPLSMEVEIIDMYKGAETRKTVTVWGDNGYLCRPYLSQFSIGKYYVMAFYKAQDDTNVNEEKTAYAISNCGEFWLPVNMKKQIAIISNTTFIEFKTLKAKFAAY